MQALTLVPDSYSKLTNVQGRLGNTTYTFPTFDAMCKAIALHPSFIGYDNDFQTYMKEQGIPFTIKGTYSYKEDIHGSYIPSK